LPRIGGNAAITREMLVGLVEQVSFTSCFAYIATDRTQSLHAYTGHGHIVAASHHEHQMWRRRPHDSLRQNAITRSTGAGVMVSVETNRLMLCDGTIAPVANRSSRSA